MGDAMGKRGKEERRDTQKWGKGGRRRKNELGRGKIKEGIEGKRRK